MVRRVRNIIIMSSDIELCIPGIEQSWWALNRGIIRINIRDHSLPLIK